MYFVVVFWFLRSFLPMHRRLSLLVRNIIIVIFCFPEHLCILFYYADFLCVFLQVYWRWPLCVMNVILIIYFFFAVFICVFAQALFQSVSISTTAGFTTTGFSDWPLFLPVLLLFSSFIGGCAGSTGGGLKVIRMLLLTLQGVREMKRLVHPRAIFIIKLGDSALSQRVVDAVWGV